MKRACVILSAIGLLLTIGPACLVFAGAISLDAHYNLMTAGMFLWFVSAPAWFRE